jgi:hypothetical protein
MWAKITQAVSVVMTVAAFIFFVLFDKERAAKVKAERKGELEKVKTQANTKAEKAHEAVVKQGPEALADDTDRMLLGDEPGAKS